MRFRRDCSAAFTFDLPALRLQRITRISLRDARLRRICTDKSCYRTWQHASLIHRIRTRGHVGVNEIIQFTITYIIKIFDVPKREIFEISDKNRDLIPSFRVDIGERYMEIILISR